MGECGEKGREKIGIEGLTKWKFWAIRKMMGVGIGNIGLVRRGKKKEG